MSNQIWFLRIVQILGIVVFSLIGLNLSVTVSIGQSSNWSQPMSLSLLHGEWYGWFPDIIADETGRVHVVWSSGLLGSSPPPKSPGEWAGFDTVMYTSSQNSRDWSPVIDIAALPAQGAVTRPALLIDKDRFLHMTFRNLDVYYSRAPLRSVSSPSSWSPPSLITHTGYYTRMAVDGQGRLHLIFTKDIFDENNLACPGCSDVFYRWSDDNGVSWSAPIDISNLPTGSVKPQILVDKQNNLHVIWEEGPGTGGIGMLNDPTKIMYTASYDRGKTWIAPVEFIAPGGRARNGAIGLDGEGKLLVVWQGLPEDMVYFQLSSDDGHSWSPPQPIAGVWGGAAVYSTKLDGYEMATDSDGNVHLVLVGRTAKDQQSLSVLHLSWDGSTWSEPEIITTLVGDVPEWPQLAIGNGNQLHVAWFVRPQAEIWTGGGKYQIWYAHGVSSASAIPAVIWPTLTSTPTLLTPTSTPFRLASPTPTPTLDPNIVKIAVPTGATESIYTDTDELMLLAKSLLPAVLVIVVTVIIFRFWHSS